MEEQLHEKHALRKELLHRKDAQIISENASSSTNSQSSFIKKFNAGDNLNIINPESTVNQIEIKSKNSLPLGCKNSEGLLRGSSQSAEKTSDIKPDGNMDGKGESFSDKHYDDERDVVKQLRNGCDSSFIYQNEDISIVSDQLENINVSQTSSEEIFKENVPEKPIVHSNNSENFTKSALKTSCTNILKYPVIPFASRDTKKECDIELSKIEKLNQNLDETATDKLCVRGKNIKKCFSFNCSTDAVTMPSTNKCTAAVKNKLSLKHACQSPYKNVLPLHACSTCHHLHVSHHHISHCPDHKNQFQCENIANELTNALSCQIPYLTNNISYCTKSALRNNQRRQSSFLKSHSVDILQNPTSIPSCHQVNVDKEQLFFQLTDIDLDEKQLKQPTSIEHTKERQQSFEVEPNVQTRTSVEENVLGIGVSAITRSLSLSSQKTGAQFKTQSLDSRPIYPNVPFSPYASPYSSPLSNRRKPPLRESRRVSIEQSGSFLQLNQYKLMDQIGQGSYGLVKLAYSEEDSTHYAMKILSKRRLLRQAGLMKRGQKKNTSPLDRVYREIAVLKKLDHPNVVKLVEVLDDPMEDSLYMVFELVKQGEVLSVPTKNPLTEERARSVFRDTLLGLEYLHYQRIVHSDIKPGNLLLTECGRVKIADLGVCNEFIGEDATMTNSTAGTPAFRAPETLNVGQNIYCGKAADVWALGATLFALVYGNVPFVASSIPTLYEKIKKETLSFPQNSKISDELKDCIRKMLKKSPAERITVPQLKEHVWVVCYGVHPLPSEEENCRLVQVNDEDINSVVRSIPKLDTLILIKTMLKNHSFGNPFSRNISGRAPQRGGSRLERFLRAGRSNSAPGSYNMILDRQLSGDKLLPALCEHSPLNNTNDETQ